MKAVIMAGGEGTRLRPLTSLRPKPMVPIVNQPVMEHILGLVKHHGIDEVVATLAFMPQVIQDYFGDGEEWGMRIDYALEETPSRHRRVGQERREALLDATRRSSSSRGDALTDIDLTRGHRRFTRRKGGAVTIALKSVPRPARVRRGHHRRGRRSRALPREAHVGPGLRDTINTGIYVVEPWVLDLIPDGAPFDFSADLFPLLMEQGHALYGCVVDGYWCDIGSRETYVQAHRDILDGEAKVYIPGVHAREGPVGRRRAPRSTRPPRSATTSSSARTSNVRAGADDRRLHRHRRQLRDRHATRASSHSVLWSDTFVGKQAQVSGAVLCRRVDVRARAMVDMGAVIGDETMVGHGAHVGADVQVYPYKRIEAAAMVGSSLIWESTGAALAVRRGGHLGARGHRHHAGARAAGWPGVREHCCPRAATSW